MTASDWIESVKKNAPILREFISNYHPANHNPRRSKDLPITAPNAELACEIVRRQIRQETNTSPEIRFDNALTQDNCATIASLLSSAWFGVPESTECWSIPGFSETCALLDDPVEQE
jgi:hypothetical protein